jgi:hypothetical protein
MQGVLSSNWYNQLPGLDGFQQGRRNQSFDTRAIQLFMLCSIGETASIYKCLP